MLFAMAYNLKRLPKLFTERQMIADYCVLTAENSRSKVIIYRLLQKITEKYSQTYK